jgi:hypothetical protein
MQEKEGEKGRISFDSGPPDLSGRPGCGNDASGECIDQAASAMQGRRLNAELAAGNRLICPR